MRKRPTRPTQICTLCVSPKRKGPSTLDWPSLFGRAHMLKRPKVGIIPAPRSFGELERLSARGTLGASENLGMASALLEQLGIAHDSRKCASDLGILMPFGSLRIPSGSLRFPFEFPSALRLPFGCPGNSGLLCARAMHVLRRPECARSHVFQAILECVPSDQRDPSSSSAVSNPVAKFKSDI